jgi:signal transduction histidine kinase
MAAEADVATLARRKLSRGRVLRMVFTLTVVLAAVASLMLRHSTVGRGSDTVLAVLVAAEATLIIAAAFLHGLVWQICVDRRSFWLGFGLIVYSGAAIWTGSTSLHDPAHIHPRSLFGAHHVLSLVALILFQVAVIRHTSDNNRGPTKAAVLLTLAAVLISIWLPALGLGVGWLGCATLHHVVSRRDTTRLLAWSALVAFGLGAANLIEAAGGASSSELSVLFTVLAVLPALLGLSGELRRRLAEGMRSGRRAATLLQGQAEFSHDAHTALFGIEATAVALSKHRTLLSSEQVDVFAQALVSEVHRLQLMIETPGVAVPVVFDLHKALLSYTTCIGVARQNVACSVAPGLLAYGSPESVTQVVAELLANASRHAPGSSVFIDARREHNEIVMSVRDLGCGLAPQLVDSVFERGVRDAANGGSGIGLHVARRLMAEQAGSLELGHTGSDGTCFVMRLPAALQDTRCDGLRQTSLSSADG